MRVRVHLEDDPGDRVLVALTLRAEGIDCAVVEVECRDEFERALDSWRAAPMCGSATRPTAALGWRC